MGSFGRGGPTCPCHGTPWQEAQGPQAGAVWGTAGGQCQGWSPGWAAAAPRCIPSPAAGTGQRLLFIPCSSSDGSRLLPSHQGRESIALTRDSYFSLPQLKIQIWPR